MTDDTFNAILEEISGYSEGIEYVKESNMSRVWKS